MAGADYSLPCSTKGLIPQKGKMCLAQTLVKSLTDEGESTATINEKNIFIDDRNRLSNIALIEYINQLNAAIQSYNAQTKNEPVRKGLFVGLQEAEFRNKVHWGDYLTLKALKTEIVGQVNFIQGTIERNGELIGQLITKLYEAKDLSEFDSITNHGAIPERKEDSTLSKETPAYLSSGLHRKLYGYFRELQTGSDFISFKIVCPIDFYAFDGHFPGNPILPGVILLEMVELALELLLEQTGMITFIKKMKIGGIVLPNQVLAGTVKIERTDELRIGFTAVFKTDAAREVSRCSGYFEKEEKYG